MYCMNCGKLLPETAKFCFECGEKVEIKSICLNCSAELVEGAKFCMECGQRIIIDGENKMDEDDYYRNIDEYSKKIMNELSPYVYHTEYGQYYSSIMCENNGYIFWQSRHTFKWFLINTKTHDVRFIMENPKEDDGCRSIHFLGINNCGIFFNANYEEYNEIRCYDFSGNLIHQCKFNMEGYGFEETRGKIYIYKDEVVISTYEEWDPWKSHLYYFSLSQRNSLDPIKISEKEHGKAEFFVEAIDEENIYYFAEFHYELDNSGDYSEAGAYCYNKKTKQIYNMNGAPIDPRRCLEESWLFEDMNIIDSDYGIYVKKIFPDKGIMITGRSREECAQAGIVSYRRQSMSNDFTLNELIDGDTLVVRKIGKATEEPILFECKISGYDNLEYIFPVEPCVEYYDGEHLFLYSFDKYAHIYKENLSVIHAGGYNEGAFGYIGEEYVYISLAGDGFVLLPKNYKSWSALENSKNYEAIDLKDWEKMADNIG